MSNDMYVALTGALGRLQELDVTANNLANSDTVGFKKLRAGFSAALDAAARGIDGKDIEGAAAAVFAAVGTPRIDTTSGPVDPTGDPLHAAVDGEGFFVVAGPDGDRYTRAGAFLIGPDGNLTTPEGLAVQGEGGPIAVGNRAVRIVSSGEIVDDRQQVLGRLRIVEFADPGALEPAGHNTLRAAGVGAVPQDVVAPRIIEGSLERSNVRPVEEMAALVQLQRSFDIVMRSLQADSQLRERLMQEIRG